ncbi:MAG: acylphosphatase [Geminicoccaceae bacterium]|nr:acylphosphatase [Geminicoccaceae bacterium]
MTAISQFLRIQGRVQGVGYRAWFRERAMAMGLCGWVRNREDGAVEALVAGDEVSVKDMVAAAGSGPRLARVDQVDRQPAEMPLRTDFRIERTV